MGTKQPSGTHWNAFQPIATYADGKSSPCIKLLCSGTRSSAYQPAASVQNTGFVLTLEDVGGGTPTVNRLKAALKRLLRDHGLRCTSITPSTSTRADAKTPSKAGGSEGMDWLTDRQASSTTTPDPTEGERRLHPPEYPADREPTNETPATTKGTDHA